MLNQVNKQPISVGILEISSQNRAILEYFFSEIGKSCFKETSVDKAASFIIDYDTPGAKDSWERTFEETQKPGIIISIKEVDLPSTVWIPKPLTVKALTDAGIAIREMISSGKEVKSTDVFGVKDAKEEEEEEEEEEKEESNEINDDLLEETFVSEALDDSATDHSLTKDTTTEETEEASALSLDNDINFTDEIIEETSFIEKIESEEKLVTGSEIFEEENEKLVDLIEEKIVEDAIEESEEEITAKALSDNIELLEELTEQPELATASTSNAAKSSDFAVSPDLIGTDHSLSDLNSMMLSDVETKIEHSSNEAGLPEDNSSQDENIDDLLATLISGGDTNNINDDEPMIEDGTGSDFDKDLKEIALETIDIENALTENEALDKDLELAQSSHDEEMQGSDLDINIDDSESHSLDKALELSLDDSVDEKNDEPIKTKAKTAEEELQSLLEEIRQEANSSPSQQPQISSSASFSQADGSYVATHAEDRWKLTCGENEDTTNLQSLCSYKPDDHVLAALLGAIKQAKLKKQVTRVKFKRIIVAIDPVSSIVYCDQSIFSESYAKICFEPISKEEIKIHKLDSSEVRLYRKKMATDSDHTHSIESFIWTTSLVTSRGRLPIGTDIKNKIGMKFWPNLTRVEKIPNTMQIAAVFHKNDACLSKTPSDLGVPQKHVIAFYNAALSLGIIKYDGVKVSSAPVKPNVKSLENKSFFSRLLKKISA